MPFPPRCGPGRGSRQGSPGDDGLFVVHRHAEERSRMSLPVYVAGALISVGGKGVAHCPRRIENAFEFRPDVPLHLGMRVRFKGV
jgi:hypothetical protein